jgi:hypothetical protein
MSYRAYRGSVARLWVEAHGLPQSVEDLRKFEDYIRRDEESCSLLERARRETDEAFQGLKVTLDNWKPVLEYPET